jgi:hypothetical protein
MMAGGTADGVINTSPGNFGKKFRNNITGWDFFDVALIKLTAIIVCDIQFVVGRDEFWK